MFYMKLGSQKVGKVTDPELWKHFWTGREGPKRSKNDPKMSVLGGLRENLIYSYAPFLTQYESENSVIFICQSYLFVKNLVFELWSNLDQSESRTL